MKKNRLYHLLLLLALFGASEFAQSQVGINTKDPKATLDIHSLSTTPTTPEGLIVPSLTRQQTISKDAVYDNTLIGAIIYVTDLSGTLTTKTRAINRIGYYTFDGTMWIPFQKEPWNKVGTNQASTENTDDIYSNGTVTINSTSALASMALTVAGQDAYINGISIGRGKGNVSSNTAVGYNILNNNTTGTTNNAIGSNALAKNTTGSYNIAVGYAALANNEKGNYNLAIGYRANENRQDSLTYNVAIGANTGFTSGNYNVAIGTNAIGTTTSGGNTIIGNGAKAAGEMLNLVIGTNASTSGGKNNTAVGYNTTSIGEGSIAIGSTARTQGTNTIAIGYGATNTVSNSIVLGNSSITSIRAAVTSITSLSDLRLKKDIQNNVPGWDFIGKLKPVTYHLDLSAEASIKGIPAESRILESEKAAEKITRSGLIAQDVESATKEIGYDFDGIYTPENEKDVYGLGYTTFVVPLVKTVQEQQSILEKQQLTIHIQQQKMNERDAEIDLLLKRIEVLESK